ncbi:LOW QUALITY PROTEIN: putative transcriptional regulator, partial [Streptomyces himastatinicus ATCC 53653]
SPSGRRTATTRRNRRWTRSVPAPSSSAAPRRRCGPGSRRSGSPGRRPRCGSRRTREPGSSWAASACPCGTAASSTAMSGCWTTATSPTWSSAAPPRPPTRGWSGRWRPRPGSEPCWRPRRGPGRSWASCCANCSPGRPATRDAACSGLHTALRGAADGPLALVAVLPWIPDTGEDEDHPGLPHLPGIAAACVIPDETALAALVRLRAPTSLAPARATAEQLLRSPRTAAADSTPPAHPLHAPGAAGPVRAAGPHGGDLPCGGGRESSAGVSEARRGLDELPAAWREALAAARAARADARLDPIAEWTAIGPYRLLATLPPAAPDASVRPLLERTHTELARTAETFLDCAGQASRTAQILGIHRQTLYYRLSRVRQLTGLDLDAGDDRLLLHMALKAARLR